MRDEHDGVEALIDAAAASLTGGAPPPALRSAVRARIAHTNRASWLIPVAAAAGVVAVVLLAVVLVGPADQPATMQPVHEPAVGRMMPNGTDRVAAVQRPARSAPRRSAVAKMLRTPPPIDVPAPEPLIDPITIEEIPTPQIAIEANSGVVPIDIKPLQIEPLQSQ